MQQSNQDQLGEAGQTAIVLFFNDLGWGPLTTGKHDLGTDIFVQVREEVQTEEARSLVDLGMLLGVQVKTGDSWFGEPTTKDGRAGWWFRESDHRHEDYWANHHVPHILIMQNEARDVQVWAKLDRASIESTGAGIRVFVPADQVIGSASAAEWTDMVAEARKLQSFEGSRWSFNITQVPPTEWPRYALLASRIVAPHPNRGNADAINWAEAVALCIQATPDRWTHFSEQHVDVPSPAEARESAEAEWRFAAAIYDWVTDSGESLEALDTSAFSDELRLAHAICVALIVEDRDEWLKANAVLQSELVDDERSVDQAWLQVQIGWAEFEVGHIAQAREAFTASVAMHASFPSSVVNSAIRSAGILGLFDAATGLSGDVEAAVRAADNTLSWWQTQQLESALNPFLRRSFSSWARDRAISIGSSDPTHNELFAAELGGRLIGNGRTARYSAYLRAIANLSLPSGDHALPEDQLDVLRAAGYPKELALAVHRFRADGPLTVVAKFMERVRVERVTTTSHDADLESLKSAGSYLSDESAREWIDYLFGELANQTATLQRFNMQFSIEHKDLDALGGLRLSFTTADQHRLIAWAIDRPENSSRLIEAPLSGLLRNLDDDVLRASTEALSARVEGLSGDSWLRALFTNVVSGVDSSARAEVGARIMQGQLGQLPSGFRIDSLSDSEAVAMLQHCSATLDTYDGQTTGGGFGGPDVYLIAGQIAVYGPQSTQDAAWEVLVRGIVASDVIQERKSAALDFLSEHVNSIPPGWREPLRAASERFQSVGPGPFGIFGSFSGLGEPGPHFKRLLLELSNDGEVWEQALSGLLTGSSLERREAIAILSRRPGHEMALGALTRDLDPDVALEAAKGLARRATEDAAVCHRWLGELLRLVANSGEQIAVHIGSGILSASQRVSEVEPLVDALRGHQSRRIRSMAHELDDAGD
jgi:hypothetical protein